MLFPKLKFRLQYFYLPELLLSIFIAVSLCKGVSCRVETNGSLVSIFNNGTVEDQDEINPIKETHFYQQLISISIKKCCGPREDLTLEGNCVENVMKYEGSGDFSVGNFGIDSDLFFVGSGIWMNATVGEVGRPKKCPNRLEIHTLTQQHIAISSNNEKVLWFLEPPAEDNIIRSFAVGLDAFCIDRSAAGDYLAEICIPSTCHANPKIEKESGSFTKDLLPSPIIDQYIPPSVSVDQPSMAQKDFIGIANVSSKNEGFKSCLRKCCLPHQLIDMQTFACVDVSSDKFWRPLISNLEQQDGLYGKKLNIYQELQPSILNLKKSSRTFSIHNSSTEEEMWNKNADIGIGISNVVGTASKFSTGEYYSIGYNEVGRVEELDANFQSDKKQEESKKFRNSGENAQPRANGGRFYQDDVRNLHLARIAYGEIEDERYENDEISGNKQKSTGFERVLHVLHSGQPQCKFGRYEMDFRRNNKGFQRGLLASSGELIIETVTGRVTKISSDRFCMDGTLPLVEDDIATGKEGVQNQVAIICFEEPTNQDDSEDVLKDLRPIIYPTLTAISSIFLLLTSIVYLILWKDLNLPGWLQFSYANALLLTFSLLTVVQLWARQVHDISDQLCRIVGYVLHASFLSSFFWLTSMNIDLWCSFRNTPTLTSFGRSRSRRRYIWFAMFSLSIPVAVTLTAIFVDDLYKSQTQQKGPTGSESELKMTLVPTQIGEDACSLTIHNKMGLLFYFYGIVGLLLMVNLMFFFCTVLCLKERQRETRFARRQCTASDSDLQRFRLFTRLFFLMGVLWIFELVSWISSFLNLDRKLQLVFVSTDCLNALQGVAIFMMFVWKPHTWKQLRKKFRKSFNIDSRTSLIGGGGTGTIKSSLKSSTSNKSSISGKNVNLT